MYDDYNTHHIEPDKICGYVFSAIVCRHCYHYINSTQPIFFGWNRPFCSQTCRSKYNTSKKNKSFYDLMTEFVNAHFDI